MLEYNKSEKTVSHPIFLDDGPVIKVFHIFTVSISSRHCLPAQRDKSEQVISSEGTNLT